MGKKVAIAFAPVSLVAVTLLLVWLVRDADVSVLNTQGLIADQERNLLLFTLLLSAVIVIPVFVLTVVIAWKFSADNKNATYTPDWAGSKKLEAIWWGIPCAIILVLAVVAWQTSHSLDPYRRISSDVRPLNIQVVALQWKWLFIYPDQKIASVNMLKFPEKTPLNFTLTSDAPMNSFWIPSLGGQVYAMSGMSTSLHLMANSTGSYKGRSANISGEGFSDMEFTANSLARAEFDAWVAESQGSVNRLDEAAYNELAKPDKATDARQYALQDAGLYDTIVKKYMEPANKRSNGEHAHMHEMKGME